jgi:uncharacterized repeat protein (TIGR01451 family)
MIFGVCMSFLFRLASFLFIPAFAVSAQLVSDTITHDYVTLTKQVPAQISFGKPYDVILRVEAERAVANVVVTDRLPASGQVVAWEPAGSQQDGQVSWVIPQMNAGDVVDIRLRVSVLQKAGHVNSCATVSATPRACVTSVIGHAVLAISKTGPAQVGLGSPFSFRISVHNQGNAPATAVSLIDELPAGLAHESGSSALRYDLGTLAANELREIEVPVKAVAPGRHCNRATVQSAESDPAAAEACVTVMDSRISLVKKGPGRAYLGKASRFEIVVGNPGNTPVTEVHVFDTPPEGARITGAGRGAIEDQRAHWYIPRIEPGEQVNLIASMTSRIAGQSCNAAHVQTAEGLTASSQSCTEWLGHPALLIEVVDTVDPLLPGESTVYLVKVTNQGTEVDRNVRIVASFPETLSPSTATGHTAATINGQTVNTAPFAILQPRQFIEWRIEAKANGKADARLRVQLFSDLLKTPVTEEESTHVY